MVLELRATCSNPTEREDFCVFYCDTSGDSSREDEVGRLYWDLHAKKRRWRWTLYWFFRPGRSGPFEGYEKTFAEASSAIEHAWLGRRLPVVEMKEIMASRCGRRFAGTGHARRWD